MLPVQTQMHTPLQCQSFLKAETFADNVDGFEQPRQTERAGDEQVYALGLPAASHL